ncbi:MAG: 4'-phosphopantetheinyl transferase superfamily protein [Pseudomonadota bacterium]
MPKPTIDADANALSAICPSEVASAALPIEGSYTLFDSEIAIVQNAVAKRKAEFAAGRAAARAALAKIGLTAQPILKAADRSPVWPNGIAGSITHTPRCAASVACQTSQFASVGLDAETSDPLKPDLRRKVLTQSEMAAATAADALTVPNCKLTFVAKEALFKAVHPITKRYFGFHDAEVFLNPDGSWSAKLDATAVKLPPSLALTHGRWIASPDHVFCIILVQPR